MGGTRTVVSPIRYGVGAWYIIELLKLFVCAAA
jgi:hypothetical protein